MSSVSQPTTFEASVEKTGWSNTRSLARIGVANLFDRSQQAKSVSQLRWAVTEAAEGVRRRRVGLSPTAARPSEAPKFIGDHTEARSEIRETTPVAPTGER